MGPTQPPIQCVPAFFYGVKGLGREVNHLHLVPRLSVSEAIPAVLCFHAFTLFNCLSFFAWVALHEEDPFDAMLSELHRM